MPDFRLSVERDGICKECGGIGGAAGAVQQCDNCQGSGIQVDSLSGNLEIDYILNPFLTDKSETAWPWDVATDPSIL